MGIQMQVAHQSFETGPHAAEMLELLFDQMTMGIAILDPEYHLLRFNSTWAGYFARYHPSMARQLQPGLGYFELHPESAAGSGTAVQGCLKWGNGSRTGLLHGDV